ncbi:MAG: ABC transporter permease [Thermoanaerobaculia bacterium]
MILAVAKNRLLNLRRDRAAFVLAFVLPVAFFTIFAAIFAGSGGRATTRKIEVLVVDEDQTANSQRFLAALKSETGLDVQTAAPPQKGAPAVAYTAASAEAAVRRGDAPVALIVPKGFGERPIAFGPAANRPELLILADSADPVAPQVLSGLVQKVVMTSMPAAMARTGAAEVDRWSGGLTPEQRARMEESLRALEAETPPGQPQAPSTAAGGGATGLVAVKTRDIVGETKKNPTVTFYAAGLGVMFLLFSAAGAGGALIEEAESGTLDRILSTRVSMTTLLAGKLVYLAGVGVVQLVLMFVWGAVFFGLDLAGHILGFIVMAIATAVASSTFGLLLASICKSRMQLVALANLSILIMSALGGSMFPRFLMPEKLQKIGLVTINAWAIDGFQKVFWRDEPLWSLWPQVLVLVGFGVAFFLLARRFARRWEIA